MNASAPRRAALPCLALGYLLSRLYALKALPIFLDEIIHIRWAYNIVDGDKLFRPWADGRLLTIWLNALVLPHVRDFLLASRLLTVGTGLLTLVLVYLVGSRLFSFEVGVLASVFYILCPFTLFYDRMVLTDSFLTTLSVLVLLLSLRLAEEGRGGIPVGVAVALAVLTKFSGILVALVPPLTLVLLGRLDGRRLWGLIAAAAAASAVLLYPLSFFLRSDMASLAFFQAKDKGFWDDTRASLLSTVSCLDTYWTRSILLLFGAGLVLALVRRDRKALLLASLSLLPTLALVVTLRVWYPRYILWETIPALLLAAWALVEFLRRLQGGLRAAAASLALGGIAASCLLVDAHFWFDPASSPLPAADVYQYVNGFPSGYGVEATLAFFQREVASNPGGITVVTHSQGRRTTWNALDLYFQDETALDLQGLDLSDPKAVEWLLSSEWVAKRPTYVVLTPRFEGSRKTTVSRTALLATARFVHRNFKPDGGVCDEVFRLPSRR